jgi:hypothetical protein
MAGPVAKAPEPGVEKEFESDWIEVPGGPLHNPSVQRNGPADLAV